MIRSPLITVMTDAVMKAAKSLRRDFGEVEALQVSRKGPGDFVSLADKRAEKLLQDALEKARPGYGFVMEEAGVIEGSDRAHKWIIDPLDGTTNFIHGFPVYAVSIALSVKGQIQQAVVYDPARNDLFHASKGRGAYLNDKRIRVSKRVRMAESLIGTGFPFRKGDNFKRYLKMFEEMSQACAGLRRPGAAALDLCYVAAGYYDGFFEMGLSPWDVAAGSLMVTEAGGLIGNFTGESDFLHQREVVAGSPRIYGQMVQILAPYTRVIKDEGEEAPAVAPEAPAVVSALAAAIAAPQPKKGPVRIRKNETEPKATRKDDAPM